MLISESVHGPTLRLDAQRNRQKVLIAAREAFLELGAEAPLEEIARRAGVGIATLYRRFPNRNGLIRAVVIDTKQQLLAEAQQALADEATAWNALSQFLRRVIRRRLGALLPVLVGQVEPDAAFRAVRDMLVSTTERMIQQAQAEGMLRLDVGFGDIQALISLLSRGLPGTTGPFRDQVAARYVELFLAGLRGRPDVQPLPGSALTPGDFEEQFRHSSPEETGSA